MVSEVSNDDGRGEGPGGVHGAAGVADLQEKHSQVSTEPSTAGF